MRLRTLALLLAGLICLPAVPIAVLAQSARRTRLQRAAYRRAMESADQKIKAEVEAHQQVVANLDYLSSMIGPRLTGSPQMQAASQWTLKQFEQYGLQAHLETTTVAHAWYRGQETAEILSPIRRRISIRALGWSRATPGPVTAPVLMADLSHPRQLRGRLRQFRGAIVLLGRPHPVNTAPADNSYDAVIPPPKGVPPPRPAGWQLRFQVMRQLMGEKPAVVILDSGKIDNLFTMGSFGGNYQPSKVPLAFLPHEDYDLLYRLLHDFHQTVRMRVNLADGFSPGPEPASITVATIRGVKHPHQTVIIGGHLDSWDLGQGSLDNGTGAMAVLEAARALKALDWKPDRTLVFILFTGEEQGGLGAKLYMKNHAAEIPKMDAALIDDVGTGKIFTIPLEHLWSTGPLMWEIYRPLREVFDLRALSTRYYGSSDHVEFIRAGVPGYLAVQKPAHYREVHHSQTDTFDKLRPHQEIENSALIAAWMWNVSQMPEPLPHHHPSQRRP